MGQFVNPDDSAFKTAYSNKIYVDKSSLINFTNDVLGTNSAFICNSRPRRFGKSTTANMLAAYYSKGADSKEMFASLEIASNPDWEKHLNKYDVIHLDIQECVNPAGGPDKVISYITKEVIRELEKYYPDIVQKKDKSLFSVLSKIYDATGNKFVIIIDEWDVLIRDDAGNQKVQEEYISFLRSIFKGVQATKYTAIAYMTGILPIKIEKTQSALNNFKEYTMIYPGFMSKFVGFTDEEVEMLCRKYEANLSEIRRWYDGYILRGCHIYNPMAVVNAVLDGECRSYWSKTANYDLIVPLINSNYDGLKNDIITMLSGSEVRVDVGTFKNDITSISSKDDVMTYLIHLGYFAYNEKKKTAYIPNEEIREEMAYAVKDKTWNEMISFTKKSDEILEAVRSGNEDAVADGIEEIHDKYIPSLQYNDENSLSCVLTLAFLSSMEFYSRPLRELPAGKGFCDFLYLPKPEYRDTYPALLVELKWDKEAESALTQIKKKNYPDSIKEYTNNILLVGINYDKKTKKHGCRIEKL